MSRHDYNLSIPFWSYLRLKVTRLTQANNASHVWVIIVSLLEKKMLLLHCHKKYPAGSATNSILKWLNLDFEKLFFFYPITFTAMCSAFSWMSLTVQGTIISLLLSFVCNTSSNDDRGILQQPGMSAERERDVQMRHTFSSGVHSKCSLLLSEMQQIDGKYRDNT